MQRIKKGDEVIVIAGKDKGRRGTVLSVLENEKVLVENINVARKHQRPNPNAGVPGGIIEREMPLDASNVMLFNPAVNKGDRVGFRFEGEGDKRRKVRYFKSDGKAVDI